MRAIMCRLPSSARPRLRCAGDRAGPDPRALDRLFGADTLWGVAAALWLLTVGAGSTDPQRIARSAADLKRRFGSDSRCLAASRSQPLLPGPGSPPSEPKGCLP